MSRSSWTVRRWRSTGTCETRISCSCCYSTSWPPSSPGPDSRREPRMRLQRACRTMRDGLAQHAWVVDVLAQGDLIAPAILWLVEEIVAGFVACGLSDEEAADAYRAVWQFTVGELIIQRGLARTAALGRT